MALKTASLPAKLQEVLDSIHDADQHARFQKFFSIAATTIHTLWDFDLAPYEDDEIGTSDLALWEVLAPLVKDTLNHVHDFLDIARAEFPATGGNDVLVDDFDFDLIETEVNRVQLETPAAPTPAIEDATPEKIQAAKGIIQAICASLSVEVAAFGDIMRKPAVMADRWYLLDHMAQFRGKFRAGVCETVFQAARVFAKVEKKDVVPYYLDELESAIVLRQGITELRSQLTLLHSALMHAKDASTMTTWASAFLAELLQFRETAAYGQMRAADKRALIQQRQHLSKLLNAPGAATGELKKLVEGLLRFFDSMGFINRREILVAHDKEACLALLLRLTHASDEFASYNIAKATAEAIACRKMIERLHGRDDHLDDATTLLNRMDLNACSPRELISVIRLLHRSVASISI